MKQFRKKPAAVTAWRCDGSKPLGFQRLEGITLVAPGDWIIIGIEWETYACKDHIFNQTYEPVDQAEPSARLMESNV
jgi:hypothetical protein